MDFSDLRNQEFIALVYILVLQAFDKRCSVNVKKNI